MSNTPYRIVIGLEVHVQLLTQSKLFCGCATQFGLKPNSATCPVCLGLPGTLPVLNRRAFELGLRAAIALDCQVADFTKWDRKNYFYPDVPKNFQTSQYDLPLGRNGHLCLPDQFESKKIQIQRIHLEEDAGKLLHDEAGGKSHSLVDLNRAGTPLLEIVSHPDLSSALEAKAYLEEMRLLLRCIEVSDCEMQEGSLRCDANVNLHVFRSETEYDATPIVECKNLNSFRAVERAIKYEVDRQYQEFLRTGCRLGEAPKSTVGWDEDKGITILQRQKEEAADYRYFPEPDLPPVVVDEAWCDRIRQSIGELPAKRRARYMDQFALSAYDAEVLIQQGKAICTYFETVSGVCGDPKSACNWTTNQVLQVLKEQSTSIADFAISAEKLGSMLVLVRSMGLNNQRAKDLFTHMLKSSQSAEDAIAELGFRVVSDESVLREMVRNALAANPKAIADYAKGKLKAADAIKGAVMRETKGMAKADVVERLVLEALRPPG